MTFWTEKSLAEMTSEEWESLCDGCGRCCLEKLEDIDTGDVSYTDVACGLLDIEKCCCSNYPQRQRFMPDCVALSPKNVGGLKWMPYTCAYRLLAEGKELPNWHPLVTGDPMSVFAAGYSVRDLAVSALEAEGDDLEDHIVELPA